VSLDAQCLLDVSLQPETWQSTGFTRHTVDTINIRVACSPSQEASRAPRQAVGQTRLQRRVSSVMCTDSQPVSARQSTRITGRRPRLIPAHRNLDVVIVISLNNQSMLHGPIQQSMIDKRELHLLLRWPATRLRMPLPKALNLVASSKESGLVKPKETLFPKRGPLPRSLERHFPRWLPHYRGRPRNNLS